VATGFLSEVFTQNPDRVDAWLAKLQDLPAAHRRIVALALWKAGNPAGVGMLKKMGMDAGHTKPVASTPVLSASSMNLQWGAFLATGDVKYITNVLAAIGTGRPGLDEAARYALAKDAAAHPRVMSICREQLATQPAQVQKVLSAAIDDAAAATGSKPKT